MTEIIRHVDHDCTTGQEHWRQADEEEVAAVHAHRASYAAQATAAAEQRDADLQLIREKAAVDPAFAALVRQTGLRLDGAS